LYCVAAAKLSNFAAFSLNFTTPTTMASRIGPAACAPGQVGTFNGVNEYIDVQLGADTNNRMLPIFGGSGQSWAVSTWVSFSAYMFDARVFDFKSSGLDQLRLGLASSTSAVTLTLVYADGTSTTTTTLPTYELVLHRWYHFMINFVSGGAMTGQLTFYIDNVSVYANPTARALDSLARPTSYIGKSNDPASSWFAGRIANFALWTRALMTEERDILFQTPPASITPFKITTITPSTGPFGSTQSVQLDSPITAANPVGFCAPDVTRVEYGPNGVGSVCASVVVTSSTRITCTVGTDAPLDVPIYFTVWMANIPGLISTASYTARGSPTLLFTAPVVAWQTDFRVPSVHAGWAGSPSTLPNCGIATFDGLTGQYIDLNLAADVTPSPVFPNTFAGTQAGFSINIWIMFQSGTYQYQRSDSCS
jgi:hypothetical protein